MFLRPSCYRLNLVHGSSLVKVRCGCRAEGRPEEIPPRIGNNEVKTEPTAKVPQTLTRGFRKSTGKLKKSKRMEAFAAALASKSRITSNDALSPDASATEVATVSDSVLSQEQSDTDNKIQIPYDTSGRTKYFQNDPDDLCVLPKPIYIISDCTGMTHDNECYKRSGILCVGESAARTVRAALGQLESKIQAHCPTTLMLHRFVSDAKRICEVVGEASKVDGLVVFTLVDPELVKATYTVCAVFEVKCVDLWSDLLDIMEGHLDAIRSVLPADHPDRRSRRTLDPDYFKRIEAVEFTRKMDDGAHPERWHLADILLLGVSRSGKTPLSIYLGQLGYKVANLPLVKELDIPPELYQIDQSKIFALALDAQYLFKIRRKRMGSMGVGGSRSMYADLKGVIEELDFAHDIYRRNPIWPVLDVTHIGVEETAARIQRILSDRQGNVERVIYA